MAGEFEKAAQELSGRELSAGELKEVRAAEALFSGLLGKAKPGFMKSIDHPDKGMSFMRGSEAEVKCPGLEGEAFKIVPALEGTGKGVHARLSLTRRIRGERVRTIHLDFNPRGRFRVSPLQTNTGEGARQTVRYHGNDFKQLLLALAPELYDKAEWGGMTRRERWRPQEARKRAHAKWLRFWTRK